MGYRVITPPTAEHVSLDDARLHLRLDAYDSPPEHPDDPLITSFIKTAREWAEKFTGRSLSPATVEATLDAFPRCERFIPLPTDPVFAVSFVRYYDAAGVERELTGWTIDWYQTPPRIQLDPDVEWPDTQARVNAVRVRFVPGYPVVGESPSGEGIPESIRSAMLLIIGHLYENREETATAASANIPMGAESLLRPYRLFGAV